MKTFITFYQTFFLIEAASDKHSFVHAFAHVFVQSRLNSFVVTSYDIKNVDCTGSAFSAFSRFVVNSSLSYLLSKCSDTPTEVCDCELDFEFENM